MNLRIGQRIRKVRGSNNLGAEAVVVDTGVFHFDSRGRPLEGIPRDLRVRYASTWLNRVGQPCPSSMLAFSNSKNWEPILPEGAAPSEFETLRDLLDSLERVRA